MASSIFSSATKLLLRCNTRLSLLDVHVLRPLKTCNGLKSQGIVSRGLTLSAGFLVKNSDDEWRAKLTSQQYHVCREKGTEPPWSGENLGSQGKGVYQCVCCGADLFSSSTKFDSGSGWPSFFDVIKGENGETCIKDVFDESHGIVRVEVLCRKCDSHLGHVFNDGPPPTGLRYCINGVALKFNPE